MHNNEILRRLTDALTLTEDRLVEIFALGGEAMAGADVLARTRDLDAEGSVACTSAELVQFLDGFILDQRGPRDTDGPPRAVVMRLTNNAILKKLRIALVLKEDDVLRIFEAGGLPITRQALSPLFRKQGNKHYRTCTDEVLRSFLTGLAK